MGKTLARFHRSLDPILGALNLNLSAQQLAHIDRHFELLERWNRKLNLTSIRDPEQIAQRHFGESLFVASILPVGAATLADIGSGAGFPGVPIAIARPEMQVSLIESVGKKCVFLKEVARVLPNAHVIQDRFERLPICFRWATVRGVAPASLWEILASRAQKLVLFRGSEAGRVQEAPVVWEQETPLPWQPHRRLCVGSLRQMQRENG